jgi:hypothetical protein
MISNKPNDLPIIASDTIFCADKSAGALALENPRLKTVLSYYIYKG